MVSAEQQVYEHCSRCGTALTDLRIFVELNIGVDRLKETGVWESIPNLDQSTREVLCKDCFDEFAALLEQMNTPSDPVTRSNTNHQQLDPLHRNGVVSAEDQPIVDENPAPTTIPPSRQSELDEAYRAKLAQASPSLDDLRKINPAEALRREVSGTPAPDNAPQVDPVLGEISPEQQAKLDEAFRQKNKPDTANATPSPARQEELDMLFRQRQAAEKPAVPPVQPAPTECQPATQPLSPTRQAELDAAYRDRASEASKPVQASSEVYRPDFSGDDTQVDTSIGMNVDGPNIQGLRQQTPASPAQTISQSVIDQQRALDLEYEKRMLARSASNPSVRIDADPALLNLVEQRSDVTYKTQ